ncbi:hypothetical protein PT276_08420 [Orbaceae bacterium ESL0721]|nr:hypothetical protein [Orbaceae bacterium ESL0721]
MELFNLRIVCFLIATTLLSGCSSSLQSPVLAVPEQVSYNDEVKIAQLSQQLVRKDIDEVTRMQLYFERGIIYDSLGFKAFAQSDFVTLLNFNPLVADIYNSLGTYALRDGDFDAAFLALNTAIELNSNYAFAYLNRSIALYRTNHFYSAKQNALKFYKFNINEPIRIIWLYLIENEIDSKDAIKTLKERYDQMSDKTVSGGDIIAFYLGYIKEDKLIQNVQKGAENNRQLAERLCETYFYLGKYYQNRGDNERAKLLFKYALATNIYNFVEHQQALYEMKLLDEK